MARGLKINSTKNKKVAAEQIYRTGFTTGYNMAIDKIKESFVHVANNVDHDYTAKVILTLISDFETLKIPKSTNKVDE